MAISSSPVTLLCQAILFDMDGILVSSLGSVERSWRAWAESRGIDPELAIHTAHGCRAIETIRKLRPDLDDQAELRFIEDLEVADNEGLTVLPGVLHLLAGLPANRWAVVTSATERLARVRLAAGGIPLPTHLVTADRVAHGKPHPEPYLTGAALLGFPPSSCVVLEDAPSGSLAGRAAGCTVLATPFSHPPEQLSAAHYLIQDLTRLSATATPGNAGLTLRFVPWEG